MSCVNPTQIELEYARWFVWLRVQHPVRPHVEHAVLAQVLLITAQIIVPNNEAMKTAHTQPTHTHRSQHTHLAHNTHVSENVRDLDFRP